MSIQRSKSAPQSIADPAIHVPRSYSHENVHKKTSMRLAIAGSSTPLGHTSSRTHKGDPFSLGNFFPTSRVSEEEDEWRWLRAEHHTIYEEAESIAPVAPAPFGQALDKMAAEAIRNEDKLGVLSLSSMFAVNGKPLPEEDRLFSPYADDEPVDIESLYQSLCERRRARSTPSDVKSTEFKELFLHADKDGEDASRWNKLLDGILIPSQ